MTKLLLSALLLCIVSTNKVKAQQSPDKITIRQSNQIAFSGSARIMTLTGSVSIIAGKLAIDKAEKIVVDKEHNKLVVYGPCTFSFSGRLEKSGTADLANARLEYNLGEEVVYIK